MDRTININININEAELREYCGIPMEAKQAFIMSQLVTIFDRQCRDMEGMAREQRMEGKIAGIKQERTMKGWASENTVIFKRLLVERGYKALEATKVVLYLKSGEYDCQVLIQAIESGSELHELLGIDSKVALMALVDSEFHSGGAASGGAASGGARGGGTNKTKRRRPKKKRSR